MPVGIFPLFPVKFLKYTRNFQQQENGLALFQARKFTKLKEVQDLLFYFTIYLIFKFDYFSNLMDKMATKDKERGFDDTQLTGRRLNIFIEFVEENQRQRHFRSNFKIQFLRIWPLTNMKSSCIDLVSDLHKLIMRLKLIQWPLRSQRCLTPILSQLANTKNKLLSGELLGQTLSDPQLRFVVSHSLTKFTKQAEDFVDYNSLASSRQESLLFVRKQVPETTNNKRCSTTAIALNKSSSKEKITDEDIRNSISAILREVEVTINESDQVSLTFTALIEQNGVCAFDLSQEDVIRQWQSCQYKMRLAEEFVENRPDLRDQYKTLKAKYNSDSVILAFQHYQQWELTIIKLLNNLSLAMQRILSEEGEQNYFSKSTFAQQSNVVRKSLLTTMIQDQMSDQKQNSMYSLCSPVKIVASEPLRQKKIHHNKHKKLFNRSLASDITKPVTKGKQKKSGTKPEQNCAACSLF